MSIVISEESAREALKAMPTEVLVCFYSISKYHEKYKFTLWVVEELEERRTPKESLNEIDKEIQDFYDALLTQEDL
jgi:hypothetical protein